MQEYLILANAIASRQCYEIVETVGYQQHLSDTGQALWTLIDEWYQRDVSSQACDRDILATRIGQQYPNHAKELQATLRTMEGKESPANFAHVLAEGRRQVLREDIIMYLADKKDVEAGEAWQQFIALDELEAGESDTIGGVSPLHLVEMVVDGETIPLAPDTLNEHIRGGLLRGQHALVFGRPEIGKSLFALNSLAAAAKAEFRGGYWENEDSIIVTQLRAAQALVGATEEELRNPSRRIERQLEARGWYDRMFFMDSPGGSLAEIRAWIKSLKLDFCVINQLANLTVRKADNRTLELGALAVGARAIAKETGCAILSVHQAGDSGDNQKVLRMGDLEWSNTAIQAAVDVLIGFGGDDDMVARDKRLLSICKNKRSGDHSKVPISVDLTRNLIL